MGAEYLSFRGLGRRLWLGEKIDRYIILAKDNSQELRRLTHGIPLERRDFEIPDGPDTPFREAYLRIHGVPAPDGIK
jgi:hypothetical protein